MRTAWVVPFCRASFPTGYSHSPAARTFTTKSRSASVRGPVGVWAMTWSAELETVLKPSIDG